MSAAGGEALNVEDVFSTYLYTGNSSTQTITNGIDLAGEGGLVWMKTRSGANVANHNLFDTVRGSTKKISTDLSLLETTETNRLTAFNSDGFDLGNSTETNYNNDKYVSWSFRKTPRFFDIVTYTGNGTAGRTISHNLGSTVGTILVKCLSTNGRWWAAYHRSTSATPQNDYLIPNRTNAKASSSAIWNNTAPTDSVFTVGSGRVEDISSGEYISTNENGLTYVAYLFAHNDGDGGFGPDGDQDIIKCGSFTVSSSGWSVDLGWEPQWIMIKRATGSSDWGIVYNIRSWDTLSGTGDNASQLRANRLYAENRETYPRITATGLTHEGAAGWLSNAQEYVYIAIRRGPMAVPESAADVFKALAYNGNNSSQDLDVGFPIDTAFIQNRTKNYTYNNWVIDRVRQPGKQLYTDLSNSTASDGSYKHLDNNFGLEFTGSGNLNGVLGGTPVPYIGYFYREAAGFFDVVTYEGNGGIGANGTQTISHNLGVAPEMLWVKARDGTYAASSSFMVYHSGVVATKALYLNADYVPSTGNWWNNTAPTDTNFSVGDNYQTNENATTFIAHLFASLPGISKVGSYTGNGSSQTIDCGFTSGASFIMIKRTDSTGNWYQWDTARGIVSGNDPHLGYNISGPTAENSSYDSVDPNNSGFNVVQNSGTNINVNNATYIFHAIA